MELWLSIFFGNRLLVTIFSFRGAVLFVNKFTYRVGYKSISNVTMIVTSENYMVCNYRIFSDADKNRSLPLLPFSAQVSSMIQSRFDGDESLCATLTITY
jgi:hypothetical protein